MKSELAVCATNYTALHSNNVFFNESLLVLNKMFKFAAHYVIKTKDNMGKP